MLMRRFAFLFVLVASAASQANTFINFDNQVNADITTFTGGSGYPQNGGIVTIAGIDHQLAKGANGKTGSMFFANETKIVPINLTGIAEIYTLINSANGINGQLNGVIEIHGTNNLVQTVTLTQGINIRDHFNGNWNNVATGLNGTVSYQTGVRFDQQKIVLDPLFHGETVTEIRFIGQNNNGGNGSPMLQSLTVVPVPEPATMVVLGLAGLAALRRRNRA